jgi:hypothetical protein
VTPLIIDEVRDFVLPTDQNKKPAMHLMNQRRTIHDLIKANNSEMKEKIKTAKSYSSRTGRLGSKGIKNIFNIEKYSDATQC